ncbi:MAG: ATP-binding cassette domain-containing protein, partial [Eubacteriales bacterium]
MLEAINLTKIYKPKKGVPVKALDGINLILPDRGMVFILGKSGSGKSTLLNVLGGLDKYDDGEIIIKGVSSKDFNQQSFDSYRNTYVGFIFQEYNVLKEFNVGANIALALELQGKRATDEEINKILHEVDLDGYGSRKPNELSVGQLQRVAIA